MTDMQSDGSEARRRFTDEASGSSSVIGPGVIVEGSLNGATNLEIGGRVEGDVKVDGMVWIRRGGRLKGRLEAASVVVEGELFGTVTATGKVDLRATSRVEADIAAAGVAAAEGSFFEGAITMSGAGSVVTYQEKRSFAGSP